MERFFVFLCSFVFLGALFIILLYRKPGGPAVSRLLQGQQRKEWQVRYEQRSSSEIQGIVLNALSRLIFAALSSLVLRCLSCPLPLFSFALHPHLQTGLAIVEMTESFQVPCYFQSASVVFIRPQFLCSRLERASQPLRNGFAM
jgi:hypothetical protein